MIHHVNLFHIIGVVQREVGYYLVSRGIVCLRIVSAANAIVLRKT